MSQRSQMGTGRGGSHTTETPGALRWPGHRAGSDERDGEWSEGNTTKARRDAKTRRAENLSADDADGRRSWGRGRGRGLSETGCGRRQRHKDTKEREGAKSREFIRRWRRCRRWGWGGGGSHTTEAPGALRWPGRRAGSDERDGSGAKATHEVTKGIKTHAETRRREEQRIYPQMAQMSQMRENGTSRPGLRAPFS